MPLSKPNDSQSGQRESGNGPDVSNSIEKKQELGKPDPDGAKMAARGFVRTALPSSPFIELHSK